MHRKTPLTPSVCRLQVCVMKHGRYLLAVDALQGKLLLVAGQAVVVGVLLDEAPGADGLLAAVAGEAVLVPTAALVLHLFRTLWAERKSKKPVRQPALLTHCVIECAPHLA